MRTLQLSRLLLKRSKSLLSFFESRAVLQASAKASAVVRHWR